MSQSDERKRRRAEYMRKYRENMSEEQRAQIREYDARRRRSSYMRRSIEGKNKRLTAEENAERKRRQAEYMKKYRKNMREEQKLHIRKYDATWHRSARWPTVEPEAEIKEEPVDPNEENVVIQPLMENATNFCQISVKVEQEDVVEIKPSVEEIALPTEQPNVRQRIKTIMDSLQAATPMKAKPLLQPEAEIKEEPVNTNEENVVIPPIAETTTNFCQISIKVEQEDVVDIKTSVEQIALPTEQSNAKQRIKTIMNNLQVREEPCTRTVRAHVSAPVLYLLLPVPTSLPKSTPELQRGKTK